MVLGLEFLEWMRIDDPIGAVPVHGFCGIWGTLSLGLFACGKYGVTGPLAADNTAPLTGLFYGGGTAVLKAQAVGSLIVVVATFSVSLIVMNVIKALGVLRVSAKGESYGLDLYEHGLPAYPEYVLSHEALPAGMLRQDEPSEAPEAPHIDVSKPEPASSIP